MSTQHTPGPWVAYNSIGGKILHRWRIRGNDMESIAVINDRWDGDAQVANAHLIATAPAMYEGLKYLVHLIGEENVPGDILATIAQAEGRHS